MGLLPGAPRTGEQQTDLIAELIVGRRRTGLVLLAGGVLVVALQSQIEWILPYDFAALRQVESTLGLSGLLSPQSLAWGWALPTLWLLWTTHRAAQAGRWVEPMALAAGLLVGSSRLAAGGVFAALMMQLLVGIMTLGWMGRREGGAGLLIGTTLATVLWDTLLSDVPTLWIVATAFMLAFIGVDHFHLRGNDRRLRSALAEQQRLIKDLDAKRAHLLELQSARTRLLAGISHDLRQPLQAMRLYGEALLARVPEVDLRALLQQQVRAADDATGMLDQFSDFTALEQGALVTAKQAVEVRRILDALAERLRASHDPAELSVKVHGRTSWVMTDPWQLTRIVQNLAANAVRYSLRAREGERARVILSVRGLTDGGLCIAVLDNGPGIPPDKLDLIFQPYVQLHQGARGKGGQGLGLSIVQGLVQQLGLRLAPVRSQIGVGTQFQVLLPRQLRCGDPSDAAGTDRSATDADRALWVTQRVLAVLDDDDRARRGLVTALEAVGAYCISAASLGELKHRIDQEPRFPDAVVIDLDLGVEQDGLAALAQLRADWAWMPPAAIISGALNSPAPDQLPHASFFLRKPASVRAISAGLEQAAALIAEVDPGPGHGAADD